MRLWVSQAEVGAGEREELATLRQENRPLGAAGASAHSAIFDFIEAGTTCTDVPAVSATSVSLTTRTH